MTHVGWEAMKQVVSTTVLVVASALCGALIALKGCSPDVPAHHSAPSTYTKLGTVTDTIQTPYGPAVLYTHRCDTLLACSSRGIGSAVHISMDSLVCDLDGARIHVCPACHRVMTGEVAKGVDGRKSRRFYCPTCDGSKAWRDDAR